MRGASGTFGGQPSFLNDVLRSLKDFRAALEHNRPILGTGAADLTVVGGRARARITTVVRPGASLEDKVAALGENLNRLRDDSLRELEQLEAADDSLRADLARLNDERAAVDAQTRTLIEKVETGGLRLERVGLFWLVIGVICASLPDELAGLISWFRN